MNIFHPRFTTLDVQTNLNLLRFDGRLGNVQRNLGPVVRATHRRRQKTLNFFTFLVDANDFGPSRIVA